MQNLKVFHLSHIDLDGYGCQLVTGHYFKDIQYYNANYGKEIDGRISQILNDIDEIGEESMILITDLNLTPKQAKFIDEEVNKRENITLLLLDHHATGKISSEAYDWYFLDDKRCATLITYEYFSFKYGSNDELELFAKVVNAVDIWRNKDPYFELGKVMMKLVHEAKEINRTLFPKENNKYIFFLLKASMKYYNSSNANIKLDEKLHYLKKSYFKKDKNNTIDNLVAHFIVDMLTQQKDRFTIWYNGHKGLLTYSIGSVSILGNEFLLQNPDFSFFMDVTARKTVALRANNRLDVSQMAKAIGDGGGHPNASGGYLKNLKDSFVYDDIKRQVIDILAGK